MMYSGTSASGLNGLLMSLGGSLTLQEGSESQPSNGRFSKLFKQLLETPEGAERLSQALSEASMNAGTALPQSLAGELSEQDWQQLEAAWQTWQQQTDQPLPLAGQPLPASVEDLLQQVRTGQSLVSSSLESANVEPPNMERLTTEPPNEATMAAVQESLLPQQPTDTADMATDAVAFSQVDGDNKQALAALANAQRPEAEAGGEDVLPPVIAARYVSKDAGPSADLRQRSRSGGEAEAKSGSANVQLATAELEASVDDGEASVTENERLAGAQRERPDAERLAGDVSAKPMDTDVAHPPVVSTPQPATAQFAAIAPAATAADEAVTFHDPLIEEAFELQDKRELNQLRGDERLRERLDLGMERQGWGLALGSRIVAMVADDVQQARIHLDPPELGTMEIRMQVQQEQTSIQVQVQSPQVREALEANAHRLREALADNGLALAGFDVTEQGSQQSGQQNEGGDSQPQADWLADGDAGENDSSTTSQTTTLSSDAILDTFA